MTYNEFFTTIFQNGSLISDAEAIILLIFIASIPVSLVVTALLSRFLPTTISVVATVVWMCYLLVVMAGNITLNLAGSTCAYIKNNISSQVSFKKEEINLPTDSTVEDCFTPTTYIQAYTIDDSDNKYVVFRDIVSKDFELRKGDRLSYIKLNVPDEIFKYIETAEDEATVVDKREKTQNYCLVTAVNGKNIYTNLDILYNIDSEDTARILTIERMYDFLCQEGYISKNISKPTQPQSTQPQPTQTQPTQTQTSRPVVLHPANPIYETNVLKAWELGTYTVLTEEQGVKTFVVDNLATKLIKDSTSLLVCDGDSLLEVHYVADDTLKNSNPSSTSGIVINNEITVDTTKDSE